VPYALDSGTCWSKGSAPASCSSVCLSVAHPAHNPRDVSPSTVHRVPTHTWSCAIAILRADTEKCSCHEGPPVPARHDTTDHTPALLTTHSGFPLMSNHECECVKSDAMTSSTSRSLTDDSQANTLRLQHKFVIVVLPKEPGLTKIGEPKEKRERGRMHTS